MADPFALVVYRMTSLSGQATPVATLPQPAGQQFTAVSAAGDDRTFVVQAITDGPGAPARFYELRLGRDGRPGPLVRLPFTLPDDVTGGNGTIMAVTPDGREIATTFVNGRRSGIAVISTTTGRLRTWTWQRPPPAYFAWSGDHAIDFTTTPASGHDTPDSLRRLSLSHRSHRLASSRVLLARFIRFGSLTRESPWRVEDFTMAAGGSTAFVALDSSTASYFHQLVVRISATTGKPLGIVGRRWWTGDNQDLSCGVPWSDASGRHLLVSCLYSGRIDNGAFTAMTIQPAPYIPYPGSAFAWGG